MATDIQDQKVATDSNDDTVSITFTHKGVSHTFDFTTNATISDLSEEFENELSIPRSNQKIMISKVGLLKVPFKDPELLLTAIADKKITLTGSTAEEAGSMAKAAEHASRRATRRSRPMQKVSAYKTRDPKREQEESQYTFTTLRPLPYLPNPEKSLQFLQKLKDDAGIKAAMRKHKFTVPLLTEMNPIEHTQSNAEGTTRTLGLNRNQGEVIELRLRTDAYDGYRDYKTIRKTLCHELAHNVWGPHDRNFWDLCKQIEKEVATADWKSGGQTVGSEEYYEGGHSEEDEVHDHGGWTGGEFVLGTSSAGGSESTGQAPTQGMSRSEVLAKAAEERRKNATGQQEDTKKQEAGQYP
ncbi:probable WSS1 Protein involved in sister chromatid separation and segregation [Phialocephala subalpina]|uniref:Probable WSS1 Protein involved in sister chromatid separation and segregation n=1 Tax=Phialocephala subalpina TaxID=576137 RepID=A0A1L7WLV8_9HELO|nr:probable WSS1 Protein involved in sister chromatid separation and segregation [Phialocephala subalpina]